MPLPLSLVLVGDVLTGRGVAPFLKSPHNTIWRYQHLLAGADLTFANLEAAPRTNRTGRKPFWNPGDLQTLRSVGFDGFSLANNHSLDAGETGARQTLSQLNTLKLQGAGLSLDGSSSIALWNVNGRRVAIVAATKWGPFSVGGARLTRLELEPLKQQIQQLTAQNIFVIASLHWGTEGVATMTTEQRSLARELIDAGALAVWGHHPHVAGTIETWKNRPILSSTGNFLWDKMKAAQSGLLVRLQVEGETPQNAKVHWKSWRVVPGVRLWKTPPTPRGETRVGSFSGRFDADNSRLSWIVWTRTTRNRPVLRAMEQQSDGGFRVRATGFPREVKRIEVGDLNGDGRDEAVVELVQRSKLDPEIKPRLHVYGLDAKGFQPLWRGSMLSRPFFAWCLAGRNDDIAFDLAALERGQNGLSWLCVYRWNGFGLRAVWQRAFKGKLHNLRSACDARGTFLSFEEFSSSGTRTLRARRVLGENWRVAQS